MAGLFAALWGKHDDEERAISSCSTINESPGGTVKLYNVVYFPFISVATLPSFPVPRQTDTITRP